MAQVRLEPPSHPRLAMLLQCPPSCAGCHQLLLQWLRQVGTNGQSGDRQTMNHQTDRSYAVETEATRKVRLAQHG